MTVERDSSVVAAVVTAEGDSSVVAAVVTAERDSSVVAADNLARVLCLSYALHGQNLLVQDNVNSL